jgi:hypothetical protein
MTTNNRRDDKAPQSKVDTFAASIEESAEKAAERIERGFINWVKNDRFFDGFRNTYARVLLVSLASIWLLGGLLFTYNNGSGFWVYAGGVVLSVLAQQVSVRFVFNAEAKDLVDEYQEARRNRAYRRAYSWVTGIVTGLVMVILFYAYANVYFTDGYLPLIPDAFINWHIGAYQVAVILVFLMGLFSLMPYFAWGFKGEPFRSKDEPNE